jgi:hypothetical protein
LKNYKKNYKTGKTMNTRQDLLKLTTVRTESVKLECLKNTELKDMKFLLKEMNIAQNTEYNDIRLSSADVSFDKCQRYACSAVMVDPLFFTEEEFENMNGLGKVIMDEIFVKIPTIGMSVKEKKEYTKRVKEIAAKHVEIQSTDVDEVTVEKK